nr:TOBE domain-containing protein [uncultured Kingella sp.]
MISARNQLPATVKNMKKGAVNDEITLELAGGATLTAIITSESTQNLGLAAGKEAVAVIKASSVLVSTDETLRLSARNRLAGTVSRIETDAVNSEVDVKVGGNTFVAIITKHSAEEMKLAVGQAVNVIVKASHVLVGVRG